MTAEELSIVVDQDFLLTKAIVLEKIHAMLSGIRDDLNGIINTHKKELPTSILGKECKISSGEKYKKLPYMVLDCPAVFSRENVFAVRTMFWWGNFFSCTLHLQGSYLEKYRSTIAQKLNHLMNKDIYLCIGDSPWEYHYDPDNYRLLNSSDISHIQSCSFLKLSSKLALKEIHSLPEFVNTFMIEMMNILA